jgi:hypothetical protein
LISTHDIKAANERILAYSKLVTNKKHNLALYAKLTADRERGALSATNEALFLDLQERVLYAPGTPARLAADSVVRNFEADSKRVTAALVEKRKMVATLKSDFESQLSNRKHREVEHAWEEVLAKYQIVYQQHFTMTLIGEHCHRFLVNHEAILEELRVILLDGIEIVVDDVAPRSADEKEALTEQIEGLIIAMREIMSALDLAVSIMREQRSHTKEECDDFGKICRYVGMLWRMHGLSVTPKIHILECHVPAFMSKFGRLFGEDSIERLHASNNRFNRVLANVRRWDERVTLREQRKNVIGLPSVAAAVAKSNQAVARGPYKVSEAKAANAVELINVRHSRKRKIVEGAPAEHDN